MVCSPAGWGERAPAGHGGTLQCRRCRGQAADKLFRASSICWRPGRRGRRSNPRAARRRERRGQAVDQRAELCRFPPAFGACSCRCVGGAMADGGGARTAAPQHRAPSAPPRRGGAGGAQHGCASACGRCARARGGATTTGAGRTETLRVNRLGRARAGGEEGRLRRSSGVRVRRQELCQQWVVASGRACRSVSGPQRCKGRGVVSGALASTRTGFRMQALDMARDILAVAPDVPAL